MADSKKKAGGAGGGGGKGAGKRPHSSASTKGRPNKEGGGGGGASGSMRSAATVRRLQMYRRKAKRDPGGRIVAQEYMSKELPNTRIIPDRRWFGNTRVVGQEQLQRFREEASSALKSNYTVLLKERKLPLSLLTESQKTKRVHLLATEPFDETFGARSRRKRPRLATSELSSLALSASRKNEEFEQRVETQTEDEDSTVNTVARHKMFDKGQSRRIWGELYKVLDSSDVVIQVLDARDPSGTRCPHLESHLKKNARHKQVVLLLNKCDLVPAWVTRGWLRALSSEYPTLAFHAGNNPAKSFGRGALMSVLRQIAKLKSEKQAISVGFVGYPNVGKSSVINSLRAKTVCKAAPVPGETKVWQYVSLTKRINLIDCPGVVYKSDDSEGDIVLKGVVRVTNLANPQEYVPMVLERVKVKYLNRAYKISSWEDMEDFLSQLAVSTGKLLKGGEPDLDTAAKMVLHDWQRGRLPYFSPPPDSDQETSGKLVEEEEANIKRGEDNSFRLAPLESASGTDEISRIPIVEGFFDEEDLKGETSLEKAINDSETVQRNAPEGNRDDELIDDSKEDDPSDNGEDEEEELSWAKVLQNTLGVDDVELIEASNRSRKPKRKKTANVVS